MIDYGSVVYGSARPYLKRLDYVQHQARRLCLGAFRTSRIPSLYAEAFEPSLSCRRDKLFLYYFRILSKDNHPLRGTLLNGNNNRLFNARPSCIPHFGPRARILFSWVPSYVGIAGNELADKSAKSATEFLTRPTVYADVRSAVNQWCHCQWQEKWNMETNNKLHVIKPVLSHWVTKLNRRCDVVLTRLRIGLARLTHKYLLSAESPPTCSHCGDILTVKRILTDCVAVNRRRLRYFRSSSFDLSFLLGQIPHFNLFMYLKDIGVFHDI
ncbi:hypothetical protein AVEN_208852-1 [Araneus ventricosus]|uniref:RNase H type-1 domain-containing protein n=1 Tax=Araneus ventricosus TaxID=182803 RepID=A0A4Y2KKG6_ARAVE|nr:hypothetical protein AVEN_208852-1 [Araneus ventricosus]